MDRAIPVASVHPRRQPPRRSSHRVRGLPRLRLTASLFQRAVLAQVEAGFHWPPEVWHRIEVFELLLSESCLAPFLAFLFSSSVVTLRHCASGGSWSTFRNSLSRLLVSFLPLLACL